MEKTESAVHEEPTMCTKKEKIGHAIGVLGHDSAYTLWAMWVPLQSDSVPILDVSARGFSGLARCSACVWH